MQLAKLYTIVAVLTFATTTLAQQQTPPAAPNTALPTPDPGFDEVHIDPLCRVLSPGKPSVKNPNPQPRYRYKNTVCHFESELSSSHTERTMQNGAPKSIFVSVHEHEYLLQNINARPVVFVVSENLRKGWRVDSEPVPTEVTDTAAVFRVRAEPGQIVRLHVGKRNH